MGFQKNSIKQSLVPGATNKPLGESKMWLKNDRLYTAREYDEELGMYYYRGRHYDPRIGRFIQRDPIGLADDVNLYRYVGNSSMNYTDPWGLNKQVVSNQSRLQIVQKFMTEVGNQCIQNTSTSSLVASCVLGDFKTSESTACDLATQIACGEVPILPDLRDTAAALYHCPGQTIGSCTSNLSLSAVGYLPVVGALKYSDEVIDLYKKTDETIAQGLKNGDGVVQQGTKAFGGLYDGMKVSSNDALKQAEKFLGNGYKDLGNGRFVSSDGLKQVRMGDSDILGKHGGGSHMNFEILTPNLQKPGKLEIKPENNLHIYIQD